MSLKFNRDYIPAIHLITGKEYPTKIQRESLLSEYPACTSLKLIGIDEDGGFCQYVAVNESMLYKVPPHLSSKYATLVEIYAIGFHANKRAGVKNGDTLVVWGAGRVGQVILQARGERRGSSGPGMHKKHQGWRNSVCVRLIG